MTNLKGRDVFIIDGARTPFLKAAGRLGDFTASDLAVNCGNVLLARQAFSPQDIDEVIIGCVAPSVNEANISRVISLRLGCGKQTPAYTVQRNCASGMQSLDNAAADIATGRADLVLAGGTEAMSHSPIVFNDNMANWLGRLNSSRTLGQKISSLLAFRPGHLKPVIGLLRGLTDPVTGLSMGQTAENIATKFAITREAMDLFSIRSHERLAHAHDTGRLAEIATMISNTGKVYDADNGLRRDSSIERLARLKPVFDRKYGRVTAGNSAQVTDGAALLLLASKAAVKRYHLKPIGKIIDVEWAGLEPAQMGLGPVHASTPILKRHKLSLADIHLWEINEAFAGQVLACIAAWNDKAYCQSELGLDTSLGELDQEILNIDGGSISTGHPVGASGARIVLHAVHSLNRLGKNKAIATLCIGGGQGGAMLLEGIAND